MFTLSESRNNLSVSIGLAVFNGENYIEEAIESILNQTYADFELVIVDNCSTDQTSQICCAYAAKDKRVRYYRNKNNLGAVHSHNQVFKLSRGRYFKWAAHDDVLGREFLSKCVNILDSDPSTILCHSKTACIDENGKRIGIYNYAVRSYSLKAHERFGDLITKRWQPSWVLIFGLIRSDVLRKSTLMKNFVGSDYHLLLDLSLVGRIYEIPEILFFRREHSGTYGYRAENLWIKGFNLGEKNAWWTNNSRITFERWRMFIEYLKSVNLSSIKWSERILCYVEILKWLIKRGWVSLAKEICIHFFTRSWVGKKVAPLLNPIFHVIGCGIK